MPAPGPDLPLRPGLDPHALPQADVRQADPDLAADRARPRALHPLLPLHALLRERLGGRPARRASTAGDLVVIATFEDEPYRAHFSRQRRRALPGRRADVDGLPLPRAPVGDPERAHRLRPLPRRLQRLGDDARGEGRPRALPQPPGGRRGLALRQGPLRPRPPAGARPHPHAARARPPPRLRGGRATKRRSTPPRRASARPARSVVVAFSGGETVEQATALARLVREGARRRRRAPPGRLGRGPRRVPRTALGDPATPSVCLVLGDDPVVERAPVVDLWLRAARRAGGRGDHASTRPATCRSPPGSAPQVCAGPSRGWRRDAGAPRHRQARSAAPSGSRSSGPRTTPPEAATSGRSQRPAREREGRGRPSTSSRGRRTGAASPPPGTRSARSSEPPAEGEIGALIVSGDEAGYDPRVAELADRARFVLTTAMFQSELTAWSHLVLPGTSYLERDGTMVNLEGRAAAAAPRRRPDGPRRARMALPPGRALRRRDRRLGGADRRGARPSCRPATSSPGRSPTRRPRPAKPAGPGLELVRYTSLFSGAAVERVPQLQFQRPAPEVELAHEDATTRDIAPGRDGRVGSNGTTKELRAKLNRKLRRASCGSPRSTPRASPTACRWRRPMPETLNQPWWIDVIKAVVVINLVMVCFAYATWLERKLLGRMQLRYGPNRAGPFGLLQPIADLVKLIRKESFSPTGAVEPPLLRGARRRGLHGARLVQRHPLRRRLGDRRLRRHRLGRGRLHRRPPHLRPRRHRHLRLPRRRLGERLEVLAARLHAHGRAARLLRGLARALRARRRGHGREPLPRRHRRASSRTRSGTRARRSSGSSSSSSPASPRRTGRRSTCPRPRPSSSPAIRRSTAACATASSPWPSTST